MKQLYPFVILFFGVYISSAQPVNDNCSSASFAGYHDGSYGFLSWDFNLYDTCIQINTASSTISYPSLRTDSTCNALGVAPVSPDVWFHFFTTGAFTIRGTQPQGVVSGNDSIKLTFFRGDSCNSIIPIRSYSYVLMGNSIFYDTIWLNANNLQESVYMSVSAIHKSDSVDFYLCFRAIDALVNPIAGCIFSSANSDTICMGYTMNSTNAPFGVNGTVSVINLEGRTPFSFLWSNGNTDSVVTDLGAGVYWVTITDAQGCSESDSVVLLSDCSVEVSATKLGPSYYRLRGLHPDTLSPKHFVWVVNSDTLIQDSAATDIVYSFQQDTTYHVCLYVTDTSYTCSFDTCFDITITNSRYVPLLDSLNIWHYVGNQVPVKEAPGNNNSRATNCGVFYSSPWEGFKEYTGSDTLINGKPYKQLWSKTLNQWPATDCLLGYIHEDIIRRRIYFLDIDSTQDILLFDFGLEEGDSIYLPFPNYTVSGIYKPGMYVVDDISDFQAGHVTSPRLEYFLKRNGDTQWQSPLRWVEGIGNLCYLVYPYIKGWYGGGLIWCNEYQNPALPQVLTCFEHDQLDFYDSCALQIVIGNSCFQYNDTCSYWVICGFVNDIASLNSIELSPNPAYKKLSVHLDVNTADDFKIQVMDVSANAVTQVYDLGNLLEGEHTKTIELPDLAPGIYLLQCSTDSGKRLLKLVIDQ